MTDIPSDVYCIITVEGSFVYINEGFLNLFSVSEQECYDFRLTDFFTSLGPLSFLKSVSYVETNLKNLRGEHFTGLLSIIPIPNTSLLVVSIRSYAEILTAKRVVTFFRRYLDRQVAVACLKYEDHQLFPFITLNTDLIDDNPSFMITLANELLQGVNNSIQSIRNYSGLINPIKLTHYQNYHSLVYIFQLLVPSNAPEGEIITETFLLSFLFPSPIINIFMDFKTIRTTIIEHIAQVTSPSELSVQLLEEIKQKVLFIDSKSIVYPSKKDQQKHNLVVFRNHLKEFSLTDAVNKFANFLTVNFGIKNINIYKNYFDEYKLINSNKSFESNILKTVSFEKLTLLKTMADFKNLKPGTNNILYVPILDRPMVNNVGFIAIKDYLPESEEEILFISKETKELFYQYHEQEKILLLSKLSQSLLKPDSIKQTNDIFEIIKNFIILVFSQEFTLFAALLYDPENESLNFTTQSGYREDFITKSIGLNSTNSVVAKAGREKTILNIPDVTICSFYLEGDHDVRSELAIPMVYNNQLIGVLNVESKKSNAFNNYHLSIMELIRDLAITNYVRLAAVKKKISLQFP